MEKYAPFKVYLGTMIAFIPMGALGFLIWIQLYIFIGSLIFTKNIYLTTILSLIYVIFTYKYFIKVTVFLIMHIGLFIAERMSDNFNSDEFVKKYTYDSFTWNPLKVWKMLFWRLKTVDEMAHDKISDDWVKNKRQEIKDKKLQKEKEFQDEVARKVEELKARNN